MVSYFVSSMFISLTLTAFISVQEFLVEQHMHLFSLYAVDFYMWFALRKLAIKFIIKTKVL